ncbi:basic proline-rich protein-like [Balaenoptera ricei]|uniref:basic proline-rich protein-like n=1 Tax=Balaenoptera ricei TaxID=2746895 RepID=UPI0028BD7D9E|nr:basic proline-rich protein-like [Balaenoptera ricei]XP_059795814.1 basic proline-rich protein-like [Balaenoptera ricei]
MKACSVYARSAWVAPAGAETLTRTRGNTQTAAQNRVLRAGRSPLRGHRQTLGHSAAPPLTRTAQPSPAGWEREGTLSRPTLAHLLAPTPQPPTPPSHLPSLQLQPPLPLISYPDPGPHPDPAPSPAPAPHLCALPGPRFLPAPVPPAVLQRPQPLRSLLCRRPPVLIRPTLLAAGAATPRGRWGPRRRLPLSLLPALPPRRPSPLAHRLSPGLGAGSGRGPPRPALYSLPPEARSLLPLAAGAAPASAGDRAAGTRRVPGEGPLAALPTRTGFSWAARRAGSGAAGPPEAGSGKTEPSGSPAESCRRLWPRR